MALGEPKAGRRFISEEKIRSKDSKTRVYAGTSLIRIRF
jgi:hypothetical protein